MNNRALIIVDFQNDFCPGGSLAVPGGNEIARPVNHMVAYGRRHRWFLAASRDWHPIETRHFASGGGVWPAHCVQDTRGAEFYPNLDRRSVIVFSKGMGADEDASSYTAFGALYLGSENIGFLGEALKTRNIKTVYVCGLATDYCVKATVLDALRLGYKTYLITDAIRAVNLAPDDGQKAIDEMAAAGVILTTTTEVLSRK